MFKKILIANRGEIACRIIKTCKRLGIQTVAVYSAADADALHVRQADEAVAIGPAAAAESYLVMDKIIAAAKETGAEAVHPGFGFLSENAAFVEALEAAGLIFIGPPVKAIGAMGDKITSKKLAAAAKVSTVPGHPDAIEDEEEAVKVAGEIGYPVMIKASAGGGGKGMRVAASEAEVREGLRSARNEARSSFGDERVFIEKFIEQPRHIEIQVLADAHGNTLHLGERECSIQRRHQKVVEEAPSPFLDPKTRAAMGAEAVALAAAVDYRSAGTVEFIVDNKKNFYFLEMNTRIQVEHPVTELITGLDLVEWMIRVAAGEPLAFAQEDVQLNGWAVETRVYAEDPLRDFMPSIGRLVRYREPVQPEEGGITVRIDSGVEEGSEISMFYDPMIAKLVTHGPDRAAAINAMQAALDAYCVRGINHNIAFLTAVMTNPRFRAGDISTNFIAEEFPDGFQGAVAAPETLEAMIGIAAILQHRRAGQEAAISGQMDGVPDFDPAKPGDWVVMLGQDQHPRRVTPVEGAYRVTHGEAALLIEVEGRLGDLVTACFIDGRPVTVQVERRGPALRLSHAGIVVEALVLAPRAAALAALMPVKEPPDLSRFLLSPMPGLLMSLAVEEGQAVKAGEELAVVEAMKMENILRAARDGRVAKVHAGPGESLAVDQAILEFD
ncbi:acetyl/propionyl/methylcrotonyl-CoA carboxylase subunit alpha [Pelagibius litoralis]|uniref:propionyl-CoA carboxylase n=1 Tax=Pelagibius litoralis TaxID=374515 RepID=A0A967F2T7_9PROT|nr:acetyl/propionyl/methylcrotonyl-CoA carboxylase subunit alpha [Pelagibius litoralis]NIA72129.1 acetyl/propionyl/methylcrotonyl-CoA carboxylase subunit alpha [Pelagibius litoralis]